MPSFCDKKHRRIKCGGNFAIPSAQLENKTELIPLHYYRMEFPGSKAPRDLLFKLFLN